LLNEFPSPKDLVNPRKSANLERRKSQMS